MYINKCRTFSSWTDTNSLDFSNDRCQSFIKKETKRNFLFFSVAIRVQVSELRGAFECSMKLKSESRGKKTCVCNDSNMSDTLRLFWYNNHLQRHFKPEWEVLPQFVFILAPASTRKDTLLIWLLLDHSNEDRLNQMTFLIVALTS